MGGILSADTSAISEENTTEQTTAIAEPAGEKQSPFPYIIAGIVVVAIVVLLIIFEREKALQK